MASALVLAGGVAIYDLTQRQHAILRNFPIVGHFRYLLEAVGPELRQYIVTDNDEERPFSRDQRRWVYASAKRENNYFGFGTDNDLELHAELPDHQARHVPAADAARRRCRLRSAVPDPVREGARAARAARAQAFRPASIVNISGMSFGSLSGPAVEALNRGAQLAGCLQNTGEGGLSPHHRKGGDLIWQIGTGYFGCRDADGRFSLARLERHVARAPQIRAIEIKLSQGAKPGLGGVLPAREDHAGDRRRSAASRWTATASARPAHTAFRDVDEHARLRRADRRRDRPAGRHQVRGRRLGVLGATSRALMAGGTRGVDFITIDGGEGGTGAAPLVFTDHVALPFKLGFSRV